MKKKVNPTIIGRFCLTPLAMIDCREALYVIYDKGIRRIERQINSNSVSFSYLSG